LTLSLVLSPVPGPRSSLVVPYGAAELRRLEAAHLRRALVLSCALALTFGFTIHQVVGVLEREIPAKPDVVIYLPPWVPLPVPGSPIPKPTLKPNPTPYGVPVAVPNLPDAAVDESSHAESTSSGSVGSDPTTRSGDSDTETRSIPDRPNPEEVFVGDIPPMAVRSVEPEYPDLARLAGVEGRVVLKALVGRDGTVQEVLVVSGPSLLVEPAVRAFQQWKFRPAVDRGRPVPVWVGQSFLFRLR
jgi:TonB family protein